MNNDQINKLKEELNISNIYSVPKINKVTINIGFGALKSEPASYRALAKILAQISGQKPMLTKAKKAIASFKLRQGETIGATVTLRGKKMEDFIIKLANITLPSIRDFKGLSKKGFDMQANYNLGIKEIMSFPEVSFDSSTSHGIGVSITTSTNDPKHAKLLLEAYGFPFEKKLKEKNG